MNGKSNSNTEFLISAIHSQPVLWQRNHKDYKNRSVTDKLWDEIGKQCTPVCTGNVVKLKWKNLRDSYKKRMQKLHIARSESGDQTLKSKWHYFEAMSFINDYVLPTDGEGNLQKTEFSDDHDDISIKEEMYEVLERSSPLFTSGTTTLTQHEIPQKRLKNERTQQLNTRFQELKGQQLTLSKKEAHREAGECSDLQFFRSLLPYMTSFTELEKLELRAEIQQLVIKKLRTKQA